MLITQAFCLYFLLVTNVQNLKQTLVKWEVCSINRLKQSMTLSFINEMKDNCQAQLKEASKATKRPDYDEKTFQKFKF